MTHFAPCASGMRAASVALMLRPPAPASSTDWHQLEARLEGFASEPVITAIAASSTTHSSWVEAAEGLTADADTPVVEEARKAAEGLMRP